MHPWAHGSASVGQAPSAKNKSGTHSGKEKHIEGVGETEDRDGDVEEKEEGGEEEEGNKEEREE